MSIEGQGHFLTLAQGSVYTSDFIWQFLPPYMGVIPNPKMAFIFPISCIFALVFPLFIKYFPKCEEKGSFPKSQIKSLYTKIQTGFSQKLLCRSEPNFV